MSGVCFARFLRISRMEWRRTLKIRFRQSRTRPPPLQVLLCSPRGFCAGVVRAIDRSSRRSRSTAPPVYVRHEIVHNRYVVESLQAKGAIFVEELDEIPDTDAPVIFSAHGVPKSVPAEAQRAQLVRARRHLPAGHQGAPRGRDPSQARPRDRADRPCRPPGSGRHHGPVAARRGHAGRDRRGRRSVSRRATPSKLAYVTQTTLSVDDTAEIVERAASAASRRSSARTRKTSATPPPTARRRSSASRRMVDAMIVVGAPNSSNSQRLQGSRRARRLPAARCWCSAPPTSTGTSSAASQRSASPPAPRRRKCWSRRSSTPSPQRYDVERRDRLRAPRRACSSRCRARCARESEAAE